MIQKETKKIIAIMTGGFQAGDMTRGTKLYDVRQEQIKAIVIILKEEGIQKALTIGVNHRAAMIEFIDINTIKTSRHDLFNMWCDSTNKKPKILVKNTISILSDSSKEQLHIKIP